MLTLFVGIAPSEAAAPRLSTRVAKLERQVRALTAQVRTRPSVYRFDTQATALDAKEAYAVCPRGKRAVGGGVEPLTSDVAVPVGVTVDRPYFQSGNAVGWYGGAEETDSYAGTWGLRVYVFCR